MERLKNQLRLAVQAQAHRLKIAVGKPVELLTARGPQALADEAIDEAGLAKLYAFLFPNDQAALAGGQTVKGALNVPSLGKVLLIAQPGAQGSLRLYLPPQGNALFESDWARLGGKAAAPAAVPPPPPPPAAKQAPGVVPGPTGLAPGESLWGPPAASAAPAPAPAVANAAPEPAAGAFGFIPPVLGDAPVAAPTLRSPAAAPAPAPAPQPFVPAAAPAAPGAFPSPWDGVQAGPVSSPAAAEGPVTINFGPDGAGEADVSDGQNLIDPLLTDMIKRKASDLHMTCGEPLCFRIDGEIQRITQTPTAPEQIEAFLAPIMPQRNRAEFAKINDTDFAYEIRGVGRFRVNIFRDKNGVGTVMRHIPSKILTAEQLGLPPAITKFCQLTKGLVVVTGPTGSGKSTTLAAMIDLINKSRHDHILTVEDPIEFVHPQQKCLVNQREVHKHTGSFARALKAALREDPDIVLIGEMRDLETVAIAIETAETGHLVFGTLHTNTAVSTVDRIINQFPTDEQEQIRMMLASSLKGVVAQTLLKKKTGGRVAAHEILVTNDAVSAMIREGKNHMIPNHMQSQKGDGNILLNESLLKLVKEGLVDAEDALRKAVDKAGMVEACKRAGIKVEAAAPGPAGQPKPGVKQSA